MKALKNKITDTKKDKIIKIKSLLLTKEGRTPKFSGFYIYQAILNNSLENEDEILYYLKEKGI